MVFTENTYTLNVNLIGLLNNSDVEHTYNNKNIYSRNVNKFSILVYENDTLHIIKQKICLKLLNLIKYENENVNTDEKKKMCIYCFNNNGNEINTSNSNDDDDDFFDDLDELDDFDNIDNNIIKCNTCNKIYKYRSGVNIKNHLKQTIQQLLPIPEFLYLWKDTKIYGHKVCKKNEYDKDYPLSTYERYSIAIEHFGFNELPLRFGIQYSQSPFKPYITSITSFSIGSGFQPHKSLILDYAVNFKHTSYHFPDLFPVENEYRPDLDIVNDTETNFIITMNYNF